MPDSVPDSIEIVIDRPPTAHQREHWIEYEPGPRMTIRISGPYERVRDFVDPIVEVAKRQEREAGRR